MRSDRKTEVDLRFRRTEGFVRSNSPAERCGRPSRRFIEKIGSFVAGLVLGPALLGPALFGQALDGQANPQGHSQPTVHSQRQTNHGQEPSSLAQENDGRVAASAIQIKSFLVQDAGLLVELKHWVAKDATDSGQVVEDVDLTDEAIFDRLDWDLPFRAVATRLLQSYGYLLPKTNPDSAIGKEQEIVIKELARRKVALELEDQQEPAVEQTPACDPREDEKCEKPKQNPKTAPPETPPPSSSSQPGTLRAEGGQGSISPPSDGIPNSKFGLPGSPSSSSEANEAPPNRNVFNPSMQDESIALDRNIPAQDTPKRSSARGADEDVTPVRMVRPANPYSDLPSLYDMYVQASVFQRPAERFGLDVFRNSSRQPDVVPMDLPVGPDYVVGPGDSLAIDLWGSVSQRFVRVVDREGRIALPEAGPLLVSGKSLDAVQIAVQEVMRKQFRNVSADVSLGRLRTVRVYVVGEVAEPGAYDISSLSTPLNALFASGGVTGRGSLRTLKQFRGKQLIQEVDAYDLLLHGIRADLKRLESGDTLLVSPVGPQVTVEGMVRRPAIYELRNETSLAEVLELAGGILPTATLRHIEVQRVEDHEKRTMLSLDLTATGDEQAVTRQLQAFQIRGGDQIHIFPIASYNEDSIFLRGHVLRPGRYSYKPGMKLADLITSYNDLLPEPAPHYGEIIRLNPPDFHPSIESFDLAAALADPASSPTLQSLDTVQIFSRFAFEPPPDVSVSGEVRAPGNYRTSGQAHLRDAIYLSGGVTQNASLESTQLFRTQPDGSMKILSVDLKEALAGNPVDNILLQPRDRILVHRSFAKIDPPTVNVKGEVAKPGRYPLTADMHVTDLVRAAGGLKRSAFSESGDLTRFAASTAGPAANQRVEVKLASALGGDLSEDPVLANGDVFTVRRIPEWDDLGASVAVRGEVEHPSSYGIQPGERLSSVLQRSGGFTAQAYPYGAVLLRREVREIEMRSHLELIERLKAEEKPLRALPEGDADQKNAKLTAIAQNETTLQQLEAIAPVGRLVIHLPPDARNLARFMKSAADIQLRNGDELIIPKKRNYVTVSGQVLNPTAVSYIPGKSAKWYLSQAGGLTQIADKRATFVIRADGSVISSRNNSTLWSGDPLNAVLKPGDSIVVAEKAQNVGPRNWGPLLQAAQVAASVALVVAYLHP